MSETKQKLIAVCVANINEEYNDAFLHAFSKYVARYNIKMLCFNSFSSLYHNDSHDIGESNIFQLINYDLLDGVILLSQTFESQTCLNQIIQSANNKNVPVVSIDFPLDSCYNILFDYDQAMENILVHLIEVHHVRRFNFIAGIKGNYYSEKRLAVFRKVLERYDIPVEEERIDYGDFWWMPTNRVMDNFLSSNLPFPEAIVCANDSMAITAFKRLTEAGYRVPEDVLVTGFDGIQEALYHTPSLTTAHHDIDTTVQTTYQIFTDLFDGKQPQKETFIPSKVMFRDSCGCLSAQDMQHDQLHHNQLIRSLFNSNDGYKSFMERQIRMTAELTDKESFQEAFESVKHYANEFSNDCFWLCIVDDFLTEEEFSDIIEESAISYKRSGYSSKMDLMLYRNHDNWYGMMDFATTDILPNLMGVLEDVDGIIFFPLHVHDQTIGYAALSYDERPLNINYCYQFFMNVSTALESIKSHGRQQTIIQNLENKYVHDPLTGLFNRRGFYQRTTEVYSKCMQEQMPIMIVSVDLNGLKPINDTYGHADGDIAISTVAKALMTASRHDDVCARFGGDEFVVAGALSSESEAQEYIDDVQKYLDDFNANSGKPYQVSASFGLIAAVPNDSITLDEFISQADEKMYAEKAKHHLSRSR